MNKIQLSHTKAAEILEHGRLCVTLTSKVTGRHMTLFLRAKNRDLHKRYITFEEGAVLFCYAGRGDDYLGHIYLRGSRAGQFVPFRGADPERVRVLSFLWNYLLTGNLNQHLEIRIESVCGRCGRPLRDDESIDRGLGPECYGKRTTSNHQAKLRLAGV